MAEVRSIAVIGAGIMGRGIAHAAALGGYRTILEDILPTALRKAETEIRANLDKAVEIGKVTKGAADEAFNRLEYASSVEQAAREADLVIEAVPEEMESKTCLEFYRSALARQRDLLSSVWKWYLLPFAPGMILFLLGLLKFVLDQPASHLHYGLVTLWFSITFAGCASVFALVGWLNRRGAKDLEKRIDALDTARIES